MVDVVPVLVLLFGFISLCKPEWLAVVHRRQKAAGTTQRPEDIHVTDSWITVTRVAGIAFILFGLIFTFQSLQ